MIASSNTLWSKARQNSTRNRIRFKTYHGDTTACFAGLPGVVPWDRSELQLLDNPCIPCWNCFNSTGWEKRGCENIAMMNRWVMIRFVSLWCRNLWTRSLSCAAEMLFNGCSPWQRSTVWHRIWKIMIAGVQCWSSMCAGWIMWRPNVDWKYDDRLWSMID